MKGATRTTGFKPYKRFLLSLGGLSSVTECFFALYAYAYLSAILPAYGAALVAVFAAAAAIALMPAVHATVNRVRSLALGRYHGVLILSSTLTPLMCAALFNIDPAGSMAYRASVAAVCLLLLFVSVQTFSYAVYSITVRVTEARPWLGYTMNALGAAVVITLTYFYFDFTPGGVGKMAYVLSALTVLAGLSVYFSTYTLIPKLIRTEPTMFGYRDDYKRFFVRPTPIALCYVGRFFFTTALLAAAVYLFRATAYVWRLDPFAFFIALCAAGGAAVLARITVRPKTRSDVKAAGVAGVVLFAVALASACVAPFVTGFERLYETISLGVCAGLAGLGYGVIAAAEKGYMADALKLTNTTRGTHKCMTGMLTTAAAATAIALCGVIDSIDLFAQSRLFVMTALSVAAFAFAALGVIFSEKGARYAVVR